MPQLKMAMPPARVVQPRPLKRLVFDRFKIMRQDVIALDRASIRAVDETSGHLHASQTNISKANVCPYNGDEIPNWKELGLDPNRTYRLLRDPQELAAGAASFHNKPLVMTHKASNAEDHDRQNTVGTVSNPRFESPYLKADLVAWPKEAVQAIQSGAQRELSCGYRYDPDMTPGTYDGQHYDGVMRNIRGNHVSLVTEGRAGPDVMVGDSMENLFMNTKKVALSRTGAFAQGALAVFLKPKLAQDAKIDFAPTFKDVTAKNFKAKTPTIVADIKRQTTGKLAKDASIDDISEVLEALAPLLPADDPEPVISDDDDDPSMDDDDADLKAKLKAKGHSDEDIAKICGGPVAAVDEDKEEEDREKEKTAMDQLKNMVSRPAMDAAMAKVAAETEKRVIATQRDIRDAERAVEPRVGQIKIACDSADDVYRAALAAMSVDMSDVPAGAARAVFNAIPAPATKPARPSIAQDAASAEGFSKRFPGAARIGHA